MQNSRCRKGECAKVLTMVNILEQNCEIVNTEKLKDLNSNLKCIQFLDMAHLVNVMPSIHCSLKLDAEASNGSHGTELKSVTDTNQYCTVI